MKRNPSETVLMRIKQEHSSVPDRVFNDTLQRFIDSYPGFFWDSKNGSITNPALGEMRGKIVILRNVAGSNIGIDYAHQFDIQDNYTVSTNWDLYQKWLDVKAAGISRIPTLLPADTAAREHRLPDLLRG
ncbi:hypothetical protein O0V01_15855 [Paenibacillus thiaminolyticus]|nr:hypothetical protein [Paenibacillus thiaminolyticus]WII35186.1 hypothetical protein O0V01_15855 [Paenibacillus thiaminolyticus]